MRTAATLYAVTVALVAVVALTASAYAYTAAARFNPADRAIWQAWAQRAAELGARSPLWPHYLTRALILTYQRRRRP